MTILTTENESYGFYGTIWTSLGGEKAAQAAWDVAFVKVQELTKMSSEDVRTFLDSRYGRYLADSVANYGANAGQAVKLAVIEHNGYKHKGKNFIIEMTKMMNCGK